MKKGICLMVIFFVFFSKTEVFSENILPDIRFIFQNPSYILQKDMQLQTYLCDPNQAECRVNYTLEIQDGGQYKAIGSQYSCLWDFWLWTPTGEEQKCNPATIVYGTGIFQTSFRVQLKTDESIFYTQIFSIQNYKEAQSEVLPPSDEADLEDILPAPISSSWGLSEPLTQPSLSGSQVPVSEEILSGATLENLPENDMIHSLSGNLISNDTGTGALTDEEKIIVIWEENIISSWTGETLLQNSGAISPIIAPLPLFPTRIIFQSPTYLLEKEEVNIQYFTCDTSQKECRVNYNWEINEWTGFKTISSQYTCVWDFWLWTLTGEEQKCNPNTIAYPVWEFTITYTLQSKSNQIWPVTQTIFIKNTGYQPPSITRTVYVESSIRSVPSIVIESPQIEIQSGLDENNISTKQDGAINLNYVQKNASEMCLWSFSWGNYEGNTHEKCNPGYVKYPYWDFRVGLKVYDKNYPENYKETFLDFSHTDSKWIQKEAETDTLQEKSWNIQNDDGEKKDISSLWNISSIDDYTLAITQVLANPAGADHLEFIEIQNNGEEPIDLKGCSLDDIISKGSKPYFFWDEMILSHHQSKKFYKYDTKLNINNSRDEAVHIICNDTVIDAMKWDFSVPEGFILKPEQDVWEVLSIKKQKKLSSYEITYRSWEKKSIPFTLHNTFFQDIMTEDITREEKKEKLFMVLEESFSQKISKQKQGIKISGITLPNSLLLITLEQTEDEISFVVPFFKKAFANTTYETKSDNTGKYELVIHEPTVWVFEVKTTLYLWENTSYDFEKTTELDIDEEDINYIFHTAKKDEWPSNYIPPKAEISLQWKLTKNKVLTQNKIVCMDAESCTINFDGSMSKWKKLKYLWNFWDGTTSEKKNPPSHTFHLWSSFISLQVDDGINTDATYFIVEVSWNTVKYESEWKENENKIEKNNKMSIIPTAYADNTKNQNITYHIILSVCVFGVFFIGSLILLRRQQII